jgi:hypothetical protein
LVTSPRQTTTQTESNSPIATEWSPRRNRTERDSSREGPSMKLLLTRDQVTTGRSTMIRPSEHRSHRMPLMWHTRFGCVQPPLPRGSAGREA